jgi:hypothetical protein
MRSLLATDRPLLAPDRRLARKRRALSAQSAALVVQQDCSVRRDPRFTKNRHFKCLFDLASIPLKPCPFAPW